MNCQMVQELLPWYPRGLTAEEAAQVAVHLRLCPACQEELAHTQALGAIVRKALEAWGEPRSQVWDRVALCTHGFRLGQLRLGSALVGLSLGFSVQGKTVPVQLELSLLGMRLPIFAYAGGA